MVKKISEPTALLAIGLLVALIAAIGGDSAGSAGVPLFGGGLVLAGIGAAWLLARGHLREHKAKRELVRH